MSDTNEEAPPIAKKKGKRGKIIVMGTALIVLVGGGVGGGLYAVKSGLIGGGKAVATDNGPKLVLKSEQKRASDKPEGGEATKADAAAAPVEGKPTPAGSGGEKFASNYYAMDKEFTSNLQNSVHFIQVGVAISTPYDDKVIDNLKTNDIAIRSAILMALGDTTEDEVFTSDGKRQLQVHLVHAINDTLKQKEGFGGVGNVYFTNFVVQ